METNIGWTQYSWNPYTWNCNKVSPGCVNCYMFAMARNLKGRDATGTPQLRENAWMELRKFTSGPVFVNSMSDTYHEGVPGRWIHRIHNTARQYAHLTFLLLTKRIERVVALAPHLDWPPNLWIGTTIENADYLWRLDYLRRIPQAAGRFVSFEPLIGSVGQPDLMGIEWIIVGGESGERRRPFNRSWAEDLLTAARRYGAAFFFKQGSARYPGQDRLLRSRLFDEVPASWNWTPTVHEKPKSAAAQSAVQMALF